MTKRKHIKVWSAIVKVLLWESAIKFSNEREPISRNMFPQNLKTIKKRMYDDNMFLQKCRCSRVFHAMNTRGLSLLER